MNSERERQEFDIFLKGRWKHIGGKRWNDVAFEIWKQLRTLEREKVELEEKLKAYEFREKWMADEIKDTTAQLNP